MAVKTLYNFKYEEENLMGEMETFEGLVGEHFINHKKRFHRPGFAILEETPVEIHWPEGVSVKLIDSRNPFACYREAEYEVRSPRELTDEDFSALRSHGAFMRGQITGQVRGEPTRVGDTYVYRCRSVCDSGD